MKNFKQNRKFEFVLVNVPCDNQLKINELTGEFMFKSECHYYCEKNILECIKSAAKAGSVDGYYGYKYGIYKVEKPKIEKSVTEKDGEKITVEKRIEGKAVLIETITVDENGITIE